MSSNFKTTPLLGYNIFDDEQIQIPVIHKLLINTLNQYSFCIAQKDAIFKDALQKADILLPDGIAIVKAVKILNNRKIKKIAGADIHLHLLKELNTIGGRCFYLGSTNNTLLKIKERISTEFPQIKLQTYSPPYKSVFSDIENRQMIGAINTFNPDLLFIGMTAPKQEKWAYMHKEQLEVKIICSIGAVFDFYAGTISRPNKLWINLGLEWFIRLVREPKRMWKRYLYYGPLFVILILTEKLKQYTNTLKATTL